MSAKKAMYLLRGIHFTLGTKLVFLCYNNVADSTLPVQCRGRADGSAPMCFLVGGEE